MAGFSSIFERLFPGKDCSTILQDPDADPMDKDICQTFKEFASGFPSMDTTIIDRDNDENDSSLDKPDAQALRDSILKKTPPNPTYRQYSKGDEDLDGQVATGVDPSLLVEPEQQRKGYSSFTRVVVTTRPDGTVEEKRIHRDSRGNETETTIVSEQRDSHDFEHSMSAWDKLFDWVWPRK